MGNWKGVFNATEKDLQIEMHGVYQAEELSLLVHLYNIAIEGCGCSNLLSGLLSKGSEFDSTKIVYIPNKGKHILMYTRVY